MVEVHVDANRKKNLPWMTCWCWVQELPALPTSLHRRPPSLELPLTLLLQSIDFYRYSSGLRARGAPPTRRRGDDTHKFRQISLVSREDGPPQATVRLPCTHTASRNSLLRPPVTRRCSRRNYPWKPARIHRKTHVSC